MSVVTPPESAAGIELRADRMDVAVDGPGRRDQPVAHDRLGVRADRQLDAVADRRVAGTPDADDPAVLDPDVGLDDADQRIDDERTRDDHVELRRAGPALGRPRSEGLRVAPDRLVARRLAVLLDADPQVGVGEAHAVAGRRAVASEPFLRGEAVHRPASPRYADQAHRPRLAGRPALARAGREVEVEAGCRGPRSNTSRGFTRSNG